MSKRQRAGSIDSVQGIPPLESGLDQGDLIFTALLSPSYIGKELQGCEEILMTRILKYEPGLKGVLLSFSDVQLVSESSRCYFELPELLCRVKAKALFFAPNPGMRISGVVTFVSAGHIALLIHGSFHASIQRHFIPNEYDFIPSSGLWKRTKKLPSNKHLPKKIEAGTELISIVVFVRTSSNDAWNIECSLLNE